MAEITATLVKALRDRTGAGMMNCKQALVEANGDIELALDNMRKLGQAEAAKKAHRIAAEGIIHIKVDQKQQSAVMVEINCETDFVAKGNSFLSFSQQVANSALSQKITTIEALQDSCDAQRVALVAQLGENITVRRMAAISGPMVGSYVHDGRIGVVLSTTVNNESTDNTKIIKQVAMHIAASKPEYLTAQDIPNDILQRERQVQLAIVTQANDPNANVNEILEKSLRQFITGIALSEQQFIMHNQQKISDVLATHGIAINKFVRFELGELTK